jgi:hypothetical protein
MSFCDEGVELNTELENQAQKSPRLTHGNPINNRVVSECIILVKHQHSSECRMSNSWHKVFVVDAVIEGTGDDIKDGNNLMDKRSLVL